MCAGLYYRVYLLPGFPSFTTGAPDTQPQHDIISDFPGDTHGYIVVCYAVSRRHTWLNSTGVLVGAFFLLGWS